MFFFGDGIGDNGFPGYLPGQVNNFKSITRGFPKNFQMMG